MSDRRQFDSPSTRSRFVWMAAAVTAAASILLAAADADGQRNRRRQAQAQFSDTTTVTVVEVPVQVVSSGAPVRGLTRDDFELLDGRRKVEITGFEFVDLSLVEGKPTQPQVPVAARRHFLLFFDLFYTTPDSVGRAQQAAADLVLTSLHPTDLVAVAVFDTRPRLVLGFTSDPQPAPAGDPFAGAGPGRRLGRARSARSCHRGHRRRAGGGRRPGWRNSSRRRHRRRLDTPGNAPGTPEPAGAGRARERSQQDRRDDGGHG